MMIMAQHPQQQQIKQPGAGGATRQHNGNKQQHEQDGIKESAQYTAASVSQISKHPIKTSITTGRSASNGAIKDTSRQSSENDCPQLQHQQQQHQQQEQDGKRTLIKNQLYLIEQLQLENANLRNERDQLQLENEELKFQLQMIR